jgi:Asp-tRNA(Asn)/Glu-tRNA(Gln) amidotransferase A subunit family amidase
MSCTSTGPRSSDSTANSPRITSTPRRTRCSKTPSRRSPEWGGGSSMSRHPTWRPRPRSGRPCAGSRPPVSTRRRTPARADEYGPDLSGLIDIGRGLSAVDYHRLLESRRDFTGRMRTLMADIDLLLLPGFGVGSPTIAQMANLGSDQKLFAAVTVPTARSTTAECRRSLCPQGSPTGALPWLHSSSARDFAEPLDPAAGHAFQQVTDHHTRHPAL